MCDSRLWLLRVLGVEGQLQLQQFSFAERCWWELLYCMTDFFVTCLVFLVFCVADCCVGGQRENHV
jgi:hypothetical protein